MSSMKNWIRALAITLAAIPTGLAAQERSAASAESSRVDVYQSGDDGPAKRRPDGAGAPDPAPVTAVTTQSGAAAAVTDEVSPAPAGDSDRPR